MPAPTRRRLVAVAAVWALLLAVPVAVVLLLVSPLPWYLDVVVSLLVGAAAVAWWWWSTPGRVLGTLGTRPADERGHARYQNLVDGLCLSFGVERPALHVLDDPALNAASLSAGASGTIVCTTGLLDGLGRVELEGVVAHELAQLRTGQATASTLAVGLIGYPLLAGDGPLGRPLAALGERSAPGRERLWRWALGPEGALVADRVAVGVTRYPPGLERALTAIRDASGPLAVSRAAAPLWIQDPHLTTTPAERRETATLHPPIDERIDVLGEL